MMSGTLLLMLLLLLMLEGLKRGCSVAAFFSFFFFAPNLFFFVFCVLLCWFVLSVEVEVPWMLMFIVADRLWRLLWQCVAWLSLLYTFEYS